MQINKLLMKNQAYKVAIKKAACAGCRVTGSGDPVQRLSSS